MTGIWSLDVSKNFGAIYDCCSEMFVDMGQDNVDDAPYSLASAVKLHTSSFSIHLPNIFHSQLVSLVQIVDNVVLSSLDVGDVRVEVEDEGIVRDLGRHEKPPKTLELADILILLSFGQCTDRVTLSNLNRFDGLESIVTIQLFLSDSSSRPHLRRLGMFSCSWNAKLRKTTATLS